MIWKITIPITIALIVIGGFYFTKGDKSEVPDIIIEVFEEATKEREIHAQLSANQDRFTVLSTTKDWNYEGKKLASGETTHEVSGKWIHWRDENSWKDIDYPNIFFSCLCFKLLGIVDYEWHMNGFLI